MMPTVTTSKPLRSAAAALAASGVTLAVTLLKTNNRDLTFTLSPWSTFSTAFSIAVVPVLIYCVLLFVCGLLGWLRSWPRALAAGTVAAFVGGALGYLIRIVLSGIELNGAAWAAVFSEALGLNFPLLVAGMLAAAFVAPAVWRRLGDEADAAGTPSVDSPGSAFFRVPSDAELARLEDADANAQWEQLVATFEEHGWGTQAVPGADNNPRASLLGDSALVLGEQVILARPNGDEPAGQRELRDALEVAGAVIDELEPPAEFDPADVVEAPGVLYVGTAATNAAAVRALRKLVAGRGYRVVVVPTAGVPLSEAMSILPDGTKLVWPAALDQPEVLGEVRLAPEPRGAAVVALAPDVLAVAAGAPKTAELLEALGYRVERVDVSALGSLPRLSLRSRD